MPKKHLQGNGLPLILFFISLELIPAYSQTVQPGEASPQISYLKFSALPFLWPGLSSGSTWLTFHLERAFSVNSKFAYNVAVEYENFTAKVYQNGVLVGTIPDNINFTVRPQVRYYLGKKTLRGAYVGAFPLYYYKNNPSFPVKGSYFGCGLIVGYQHFIKNKFPIELNFRAQEQIGTITLNYTSGPPIQQDDAYLYGFFEVNIGIPLTFRKK